MSREMRRQPIHHAAAQALREGLLPAVPRSTQIRPQGVCEQDQITIEYRIAYEYHGMAMAMPVAAHVSACLLEHLGAQPEFTNLRLQSRIVTGWSDVDGAASHAESV